MTTPMTTKTHNEQDVEITQPKNPDSDPYDAAIRATKERHLIQRIGISSVKMNYLFIIIIIIQSIINGTLGWYAIHPVREYFAADNGRIISMVPLSRPYQNKAAIIQFARDELTKTFALDFVHWRSQLEDIRSSYTNPGFKSVLSSLETSGVLETIKTRRMNMSATAGTGVLVRQGIENGVYFSIIELPLEIKLSGQTTELPPQRFLALVRVERISVLDSIKGIAIGQVVTKPL